MNNFMEHLQLFFLFINILSKKCNEDWLKINENVIIILIKNITELDKTLNVSLKANNSYKNRSDDSDFTNWIQNSYSLSVQLYLFDIFIGLSFRLAVGWTTVRSSIQSKKCDFLLTKITGRLINILLCFITFSIR